MKNPNILITMREDLFHSYDECRDGIDKRWYQLILEAGFTPLLVPNNRNVVTSMIKNISVVGVILSGGNSLQKYGGTAPERDEIEQELMAFASDKGIPLLGVCRGMQFILDYFGSELIEVDNHVATTHTLSHLNIHPINNILSQLPKVNSYHNLAATDCSMLKILALSEEGYIEACAHPSKSIFGIMWHPERDCEHEKIHIQLLRYIFETSST